jgi:nicotinate-nucleotide adenylyltransferase
VVGLTNSQANSRFSTHTRMKIGVFGGTFNPPHIAHLVLADEACYQLGLDRLLWVLTPDPPHKRGLPILAISDRLELLAAALASNSSFQLSRVDIDRPPPHYAVDTMFILKERHPEDDLIYLMGGDSLHDLPSWYKPDQFLQACSALGVMRRPGDQVNLTSIERRLPGVTSKVRFIRTPLLEISATSLRERIAQSEPYRYYLPAPVYEIIRERGLYKET